MEACDTGLAKNLSTIAKNEWRSIHLLPVNPHVIYAASDASDNFGGFMEILMNIPAVVDTHIIPWDNDLVKAHIFIKELLAAVLCVEHILRRAERIDAIILACDNTAACSILQRGYSSNTHATTLVTRLKTATDRAACRLRIVQVRGVDNVADNPSRGLTSIEPHRLTATVEQLRGASQGWSKLWPTTRYSKALRGYGTRKATLLISRRGPD